MKRLFIYFICALFMFDAANAAITKGCSSGYYSSGTDCIKCPDGTTTPMGNFGSMYHHYTHCAPAWLRYQYTPPATDGMFSFTTTESISFNLEKPTAPALAARVGNKTMYAAMARATTQQSGGLYVKYNNQVYHILANPLESKFTITTTSSTNNFSFKMSAMGTFYVDWGDGVIDEIIRTDTTSTTYSHTYATADKYKIGFAGTATGYSTGTDNTDAAISFSNNKNVAGISGSLGEIFSTLTHTSCPDGSILCNDNQLITSVEQPMFRETFNGCTNLSSSIPDKLFSGLSGQPRTYMFRNMFFKCSKLSGNIPDNLFGDISGTPVEHVFSSIFRDCSSLTGSIPPKLFAGIRGAPARYMFGEIFHNCSGLTGNIPSELFGGISGVGAEGMYSNTFNGCTGLTGEIPMGLFGDIYGEPANYMFQWTFSGCSNLSGPSAQTPNGIPFYKYSYNGSSWSNNTLAFRYMYSGTNLSDNASIPSGWK